MTIRNGQKLPYRARIPTPISVRHLLPPTMSPHRLPPFSPLRLPVHYQCHPSTSPVLPHFQQLRAFGAWIRGQGTKKQQTFVILNTIPKIVRCILVCMMYRYVSNIDSLLLKRAYLTQVSERCCATLHCTTIHYYGTVISIFPFP
jgi:hypothetical protein